MKESGTAGAQASKDWNANLYDSKHAFVWKFGSDVVSLLAPQRDERILDIGCGTGHLTAQIADTGAHVVGVDSSPDMVAAARKEFPELRFEIADARELAFDSEFDAVFSNATLHWIHEPARVIEGVRKALRVGGRFVGELGGKGNIGKMQKAFDEVLVEMLHATKGEINPWYYPSVGQYAGLLEAAGFEVRFMTLFDRPTLLTDGEVGLRNWISMFASAYTARVPADKREDFFRSVEDLLRPELFKDGNWWADYRRLRFVACK